MPIVRGGDTSQSSSSSSGGAPPPGPAPPDDDLEQYPGQHPRQHQLAPVEPVRPDVPDTPAPAPKPEESSQADVWAAAYRQGNLVGTLYDRYWAHPMPNTPAVKGYDPVAHTPAGYEEYADNFIGLQNEAQVQWMKRRIDAENQDRETIRNGGALGFTASMVSGATDPLTLASMAIPVGEAGMLARAGKMALIGAGTQAASDVAMSPYHPTKTREEALTDIAAAAAGTPLLDGIIHLGGRTVLRSILGSRYGRVPASTRDALERGIAGELRDPDSPLRVMGQGQPDILHGIPELHEPLITMPDTRTAAEQLAEPRVSMLPEKLPPVEELARAKKGEVQTSPAVADVDPETHALHEAIALSKVKGATKRGLDIDEVARLTGWDKSELKGLSFGKRRVFNSGGASVSDMMQVMEKHGYPVGTQDDFLQHLGNALEGYRTYSKHVPTMSELDDIYAELNESSAQYAKDQAEAQAREQYAASHAEPHGEFSWQGETVHPEPRPPAPGASQAAMGKVANQIQTAAKGAPPGAGAPPAGAGQPPGATAAGGAAAAGAPPVPPTKGPLPGNPLRPGTNEGLAAGATPIGTLVGLPRAVAKWLKAGRIGPLDINSFSPSIRLLRSPSQMAQLAAQWLNNVPEILQKNLAGIATPRPVSREIWQIPALVMQAHRITEQGFHAYQQTWNQTGMAALRPKGGFIGRNQFMEAVGDALRNGDSHAIPEVQQAASYIRRDIIEPITQRAQAAGSLPAQLAPPVGAKSYFPRIYNVLKIMRERSTWDGILVRGLMQQNRTLALADAKEVATNITNAILKFENGPETWQAINQAIQVGPTRQRTLTIPDNDLHDYLHSDVNHVMDRWVRQMVPDIAMRERFGNTDMQLQLDQMKKEYMGLRDAANADPYLQANRPRLDKYLQYLTLREKQDNRDLLMMRDRLFNRYNVPEDAGNFVVQTARNLRAWGVVTQLGVAAASHITDLGNAILRYGFNPQGLHALAMMMNPLKGQLAKLSLEDAKLFGGAADTSHNILNKVLGDYANLPRGPIGEKLQGMVGGWDMPGTGGNVRVPGFTTLSGETIIIDRVQAIASLLQQHEILKSAEQVIAGKTLSQRRITALAAAGIDQPMLQRIAAQYTQHGQRIQSFRFGHPGDWTDKEAANTFSSAVARGMHETTLRPDVGDTPAIMSDEVGRTLLQFTNFAFAARGIQSRVGQGLAVQGWGGRAHTVGALAGLLGLAYATYWLKQASAGAPRESIGAHPFHMAEELLDRANLLGIGGRALPLAWQFGDHELSRWSDSDPDAVLFGPSAEKLGDIWRSRIGGKAIGVLPWTTKDTHFIRRLLPFQNHWALRQGIDAMEDGLDDAMGVPGKRVWQRKEQAWQKAENEE